MPRFVPASSLRLRENNSGAIELLSSGDKLESKVRKGEGTGREEEGRQEKPRGGGDHERLAILSAFVFRPYSEIGRRFSSSGRLGCCPSLRLGVMWCDVQPPNRRNVTCPETFVVRMS